MQRAKEAEAELPETKSFEEMAQEVSPPSPKPKKAEEVLPPPIPKVRIPWSHALLPKFVEDILRFGSTPIRSPAFGGERSHDRFHICHGDQFLLLFFGFE
jgi:hypothetical protein